jgi:hypothetical protein
MAIGNRDYTAGRFELVIDGKKASYSAGYTKKFSGLQMMGDIVTNDLGPDNIQMKHMANMKWGPGKASVGIGMGQSLYEWMQLAFDKQYETRNGHVNVADFNGFAQSRINFTNAHLTSIGIPKLDGSSREAAYFDIEFDAEYVRWIKGDGQQVSGIVGPKQKQWLCSNFRVEIDDNGNLPLPCDRVASVDAFAWKCAVQPNYIGIHREPIKAPAKVTVPDLKLSISNADFEAWSKAAHKWFVEGYHREVDHRTGRIVFLDPDMVHELGEIELMGIGFKQFGQDDGEANAEKIKRFTVELYVERMKFKIFEYNSAQR